MKTDSPTVSETRLTTLKPRPLLAWQQNKDFQILTYDQVFSGMSL